MSRKSRDQGMVDPPAEIFRPAICVIGPVGPCSPGIHFGYQSVSGPGCAGMTMCEWRMRRGASVALMVMRIGAAEAATAENIDRQRMDTHALRMGAKCSA